MQGTLHIYLEEKETKEAADAQAISHTELRHDVALPRNHLTGRRVSLQHTRKLKHPHTVLPSVAPETDMPEFELAAPRRHSVFGHHTFMRQPAPENFHWTLPTEVILGLYASGFNPEKKKYAAILFCRTDKAAEQFQFDTLDEIISNMVRHIYLRSDIDECELEEGTLNFHELFTASLWKVIEARLNKTVFSLRVHGQIYLAKALMATMQGDQDTLGHCLTVIQLDLKERLPWYVEETLPSTSYFRQKLAPLDHTDFKEHEDDPTSEMTPAVIMELVKQCDHYRYHLPLAISILEHSLPPMLDFKEVIEHISASDLEEFARHQPFDLSSLDTYKPHSLGWYLQLRYFCARYLSAEGNSHIQQQELEIIKTAIPQIAICPSAIDLVASTKSFRLMEQLLAHSDQTLTTHIRSNLNFYTESTTDENSKAYLAVANHRKIADAYATLISYTITQCDEPIDETMQEARKFVRAIVTASDSTIKQAYDALKLLPLYIQLNLITAMLRANMHREVIVCNLLDSIRSGLQSEDVSLRTQAQEQLQDLTTWLTDENSNPDGSVARLVIWCDDLFSLTERTERLALLDGWTRAELLEENGVAQFMLPERLRLLFLNFVNTHMLSYSREALHDEQGLLFDKFLEAHLDIALTLCQQTYEPPAEGQPETTATLHPTFVASLIRTVDDPAALVNLFTNQLSRHPTSPPPDYPTLEVFAILIDKTKTAEERVTWEQVLNLVESSSKWLSDTRTKYSPEIWLNIVTSFADDPDAQYDSIQDVPLHIRNHPRVTQHVQKRSKWASMPMVSFFPQLIEPLTTLFQQLTSEQQALVVECRKNRIGEPADTNLFDHASVFADMNNREAPPCPG